MDAFYTVAREGEGVYEEKRSRFLGFARPVFSEADAIGFVEDLRRLHPDARHHVYAYTVDFGAKERMSDDGEPQGTGGARVLTAIKQAGLSNVCVVIVRYFGGTLLGAGPLARAYSAAALSAIENAGTVRCESCGVYRITLPYARQSRVEQELKKRGAKVLDSVFAERVTHTFSVRLADAPDLIASLGELSAGELVPELLEQRFLPTAESIP